MAVDRYFNSAESSAGMLCTEDWNRANWFETENDEQNDLNFGWRSTISQQARWYDYVPTDTVTPTYPAVNVSNAINGAKCGQNGGGPDVGTAGTGWAARKFFSPDGTRTQDSSTDTSEVYIRLYLKIIDPSTVDSLAYNSGHLKIVEIQTRDGQGADEFGWIHSPNASGNLAWYASEQITEGADGWPSGASHIQFPTSPQNESSNTSNYALTTNTWHYIEYRIKLNTYGTANGTVQFWADDAGSDGTNNIGSGTERYLWTSTAIRPNNGGSDIESIELEGWMPSSGNTGTVHLYYAYFACSTSRIGPYEALWGGGGGGGGGVTKGASFSYFR